MRFALLCMLEAVEGELGLSGVLEVMRFVLLCALEAVDGGFCLLEVTRCVLRTLYAGGCGR